MDYTETGEAGPGRLQPPRASTEVEALRPEKTITERLFPDKSELSNPIRTTEDDGANPRLSQQGVHPSYRQRRLHRRCAKRAQLVLTGNVRISAARHLQLPGGLWT